jgi:hypothetical protein
MRCRNVRGLSPSNSEHTSWFLTNTPALKAEPQNRGVVLSARGGRQISPNDVQRACIGWLQTHDCGADVSDQQRATCDKVRAVVGVFGR